MQAPPVTSQAPSAGWTKSVKDLFPIPRVATTAAETSKTASVAVSIMSAPPAAAGSDPFGRLSVSLEELKKDFEESKREREGRAPRPLTMTLTEVALKAMRFSQASVAKQTKNEMSLKALEAAVRKNWDGPPLPVVRYDDGSYTTLGNRRLCAIQEIIRKGGSLNIPAQVHHASDKAPAEVVDEERNSYLQRLALKARSPRKDYIELLSDQHDKTLAKHGLIKGSYGEWVYIRTRSDWKYHPAEGEAIQGYPLTPFFH